MVMGGFGAATYFFQIVTVSLTVHTSGFFLNASKLSANAEILFG